MLERGEGLCNAGCVCVCVCVHVLMCMLHCVLVNNGACLTIFDHCVDLLHHYLCCASMRLFLLPVAFTCILLFMFLCVTTQVQHQ